jgi:putative ABC transport system permease protein
MPADIGWTGLAASLALVGAAVVLSLRYRLGLERSMIWAAARALTQLLAVGAILDFVFDVHRSLAWSWAWILVMQVIAAETVQRRAPQLGRIGFLAFLAFLAAGVVTLSLLFGLSVFDLEARTLVPSAGLLLGNSLPAAVLIARRLPDELSARRDEVEARLALGLPAPEAARPYFRLAMRDALTPQIESTKAVGLIALPGTMTGLILAGLPPLQAVKVQAAVMFLILGSVAVTVTVIGFGVRRRLFTADHRLVLPAPPSRQEQ